MHIDSDVTLPALLDGGDGNDELRAGGGKSTLLGGNGCDNLYGGLAADVLDGGAGDDYLIGGRGRDLLVGGEDDDELDGGDEDDVLIGGRVTVSRAVLEAVRDTWSGAGSYDARRTALTAVLNSSNVFDDADKDRLKGNKGRDLFFAKLSGSNKDELKDKAFDEFVYNL